MCIFLLQNWPGRPGMPDWPKLPAKWHFSKVNNFANIYGTTMKLCTSNDRGPIRLVAKQQLVKCAKNGQSGVRANSTNSTSGVLFLVLIFYLSSGGSVLKVR